MLCDEALPVAEDGEGAEQERAEGKIEQAREQHEQAAQIIAEDNGRDAKVIPTKEENKDFSFLESEMKPQLS